MKTDQPLHVATKVRVDLTATSDLRQSVLDSVQQSLARLKRSRITLLQIHNSIIWNRNDQPTSITPDDVLGPRGILEGMHEARDAGWIEHFGPTGIGEADALRTVMQSREFAAIQAPVHLLNPSALRETPPELCDSEYGDFCEQPTNWAWAFSQSGSLPLGHC